jgi:hypothetical protein
LLKIREWCIVYAQPQLTPPNYVMMDPAFLLLFFTLIPSVDNMPDKEVFRLPNVLVQDISRKYANVKLKKGTKLTSYKHGILNNT